MLEFEQGFLEIFWHGIVAHACGIFPVNGESEEEGASPVDGDGVDFLEGLDEVVGVRFAYILDPKVINDEGENDGLGGVLPERRGSGHRGEAKIYEVRFASVLAMRPACLRPGTP